MNYTDEDKEDKKYKKGYSKKEFKKDVQEAVEPVMQKMGKKKPIKKPTKKLSGAYSKMSAGELRKFLQQKKNALLTKSGFPDGKIPKGRDAMVALCKKLKRKRW